MTAAIEAKNVDMVFNMRKDKILSLKEYLIKAAKRELHYEAFHALTDVSLTVERGDIYGLIGLNGSGKSTLLKIISGILQPTRGTVATEGLIAPLIELGAGFDMDMNARENVYLNGSILGYSKEYMEAHFDEIIDFAEVREFMDAPVKNFSSGMITRLGFAVATVTEPDILILDEVLSVGDAAFQKKSENRIREMIRRGVTVLFVSHAMGMVKSLCNKALWLDHGHMRMTGPAGEVCDAYLESLGLPVE
jgi:ABC-type polysaccharide/polyol phosphate transport system ATPase subunit